MTNAWESARTTLNLNAELQSKLLNSLLVILALWLLRLVILFWVDRRVEDDGLRYQWRKTSTYIVVPLGVALLFRIWIEELQPLATFLGFFSAGVAVALRDPLVDLAGWTFILWRRPFEVGDRIQIGEHADDVVDLRIFQFTLLEVGGWVAADQSTGRILHIPNGKVFSDVLANYGKGFEYMVLALQFAICVSPGGAARARRRYGKTCYEPSPSTTTSNSRIRRSVFTIAGSRARKRGCMARTGRKAREVSDGQGFGDLKDGRRKTGQKSGGMRG